MKSDKTMQPGGDGPPVAPKTFTSPPKIGTDDVWEAAQAEVDAVPQEEVQKPRVDLQPAAESALTVCDFVRGDAGLYARFMAQAAAGECDPDGLRKLQRYAGAAWHARRMQVSVEGAESGANVPAAVLVEGEAIYGRMHAVVTYYLGKNPEAAPFLANLNAAPGHRRLANRLITLADLYRDHRATVSVDTVNYRDTDERAARDTATVIVGALHDSSVSHGELWGGRAARAWTLLSACYAEVQAVGLFLLRKTPDAARQRFPSLVAESRSPAQPRKPAEPAAPVADPAAPANVAAPAKPAGPVADAPVVAAPVVAEPATPRAGAAPAAPKRKRKR